MLEVCIDEGVPVETSVYKPDALAPRIKEAGLRWIHKAARVKDAIQQRGISSPGIIHNSALIVKYASNEYLDELGSRGSEINIPQRAREKETICRHTVKR